MDSMYCLIKRAGKKPTIVAMSDIYAADHTGRYRKQATEAILKETENGVKRTLRVYEGQIGHAVTVLNSARSAELLQRDLGRPKRLRFPKRHSISPAQLRRKSPKMGGVEKAKKRRKELLVAGHNIAAAADHEIMNSESVKRPRNRSTVKFSPGIGITIPPPILPVRRKAYKKSGFDGDRSSSDKGEEDAAAEPTSEYSDDENKSSLDGDGRTSDKGEEDVASEPPPEESDDEKRSSFDGDDIMNYKENEEKRATSPEQSEDEKRSSFDGDDIMNYNENEEKRATSPEQSEDENKSSFDGDDIMNCKENEEKRATSPEQSEDEKRSNDDNDNASDTDSDGKSDSSLVKAITSTIRKEFRRHYGKETDKKNAFKSDGKGNVIVTSKVTLSRSAV